jgi:hypothetical protein
LPDFGLTHFACPAGHTVLVLTLHVPCTQLSPGFVAGWQVPHIAVAERAQKVVTH